MPATSLQPIPSLRHGVPPSKSSGGFRGPWSPSFGQAFGVKEFHGAWCSVVPWVMPKDAPWGARAWRCSLCSPKPAAERSGAEPAAWTGNGGVGNCWVLSWCLVLAGGILGRSLAGSPSGCCSTPKTPEGPSWSGRVRPRKVSGSGEGQPGGAPLWGVCGHLHGVPGPLGHSAPSRFPQLRSWGRRREESYLVDRSQHLGSLSLGSPLRVLVPREQVLMNPLNHQ